MFVFILMFGWNLGFEVDFEFFVCVEIFVSSGSVCRVCDVDVKFWWFDGNLGYNE